MRFALMAGAIFTISCGLVWLFIKACGNVTHSMFEERDDHELAMHLQGARRREADARRQAGGAMPAVPARERGPRDPAIGVDQARAEVRERIRRYNAATGREMKPYVHADINELLHDIASEKKAR